MNCRDKAETVNASTKQHMGKNIEKQLVQLRQRYTREEKGYGCPAPVRRSTVKRWLSHLSRRRQWQPTPLLLPGKSHGQRSLEGCSPWGCEESDTTERLHFHFSLSCTGEGKGNPLQCSCLENSSNGGAWWAAVYGVTQSWTRLK